MTAQAAASPDSRRELHVSCNQWAWVMFYRRQGRDFNSDLDAGLADVAAAGFDGFEMNIERDGDIDRIAPLLARHKLAMRSVYFNSTLHLADQVENSTDFVLRECRAARSVGAEIISINPTPIDWNNPKDKTDEQLRTQAGALGKLSGELKKLGLTLAYHNHDAELRCAAREFHHMMLADEAANVTLCLDADWIYRGSGRSIVALFDVLKMYGNRVSEMHLRQSVNGVWSETFGPGDVDFVAVAKYLRQLGVRPHIVVEQAWEKQTPRTMSPVEALSRSVRAVRDLLSGIV